MQRQALTGVEADPQVPALPGDLVAVDGEAGPLGLGDLDRLERGARRDVAVAAVFRRHGHVTLVLDAEHALLGEVDVHDQALDRMRPGAVGLVVAQERQGTDDPAGLVGPAEEAGSQGSTEGVLDAVAEPAPLHRGLPFRRRLGDRRGEVVFLEQVRGLALTAVLAGDQLAFRQRNDDVAGLPGRGVQQRVLDAAIRGGLGLVRLHRQHRRKPRRVGQRAFRGQDRAACGEFVGGQRVEWMRPGHTSQSCGSARVGKDREGVMRPRTRKMH